MDCPGYRVMDEQSNLEQHPGTLESPWEGGMVGKKGSAGDKWHTYQFRRV